MVSGITPVLVNGEVSDGRIPVTDSSVLRGDGCFEVIKAYGGGLFRLEEHLERLERSARALDIELPPLADLASWAGQTAAAVGEGAVRMVVTRGSSVPGVTGESLVIVFGHDWARADAPARLLPVVAPWHAAGVEWDLSGAKITSYAPNMASTRRAHRQGYDDALLLSTDGLILEGPTFSVGWVVDGVVETPPLELGILDSITRRVVFELIAELGMELIETHSPLERLDRADEVLAFSTIREIQPVVAVGDREFASGPVTSRLHTAFLELVGHRADSGTLSSTDTLRSP